MVLAPFTPPNSDVSCTPGTCAMISGTVVRRRMRDLFGGDHGRGRADDAVELPAAGAAAAGAGAVPMLASERPVPVPREGAAMRAATRRAAAFIDRRSGAGLVLVGSAD